MLANNLNKDYIEESVLYINNFDEKEREINRNNKNQLKISFIEKNFK